MSPPHFEAVARARAITDHPPADLDRKAVERVLRELKRQSDYKVARRLLQAVSGVLREPADERWRVQQLALCTHRDHDLIPSDRFAGAFELLAPLIRDAAEQQDAETLSLAGDIAQERWRFGGQIEHLHEALELYRGAWKLSIAQTGPAGEPLPSTDDGHSAAHAAFILDLMASRARVRSRRTGHPSTEEMRLRQEAADLRREALRLRRPKSALDADDRERAYAYFVIRAELHLGLAEDRQAETALREAASYEPTEWELRSTFSRFTALARLRGAAPPREEDGVDDWAPAWKVLTALAPVEEIRRATPSTPGKVGLALSGGGFRASLFHLGALARFAEADVLRAVEALSTVSGGSIVGAQYYLEVQRLLEHKPDGEITREDYIQLVERLQRRFLAGVQRNLRTRTLASFGANLRAIFSREYSRSHRIGELYESELYAVIGPEGKEKTTPRTMSELLIRPVDFPGDEIEFKPAAMNWRRRAKVPVLLLNAASLNSGHSWCFTARWMGEPPESIGCEADMNERYRRLWYEQAPKIDHRNYRLGYAVAASACVPGLFEPLVLEDLYPGRTIRLVDGGVHDNQGVDGLLAEGCTFIFCSDASGQMEDQRRPTNTLLGVPLRANSILMDRVREAQYQDLRARLDSRSLQGLFYVHLKQGLDSLPIDWIECQDPTVPPAAFGSTTSYQVDRDIQRKLAAIRTDLDSFTEVEAYALMASGYLMTDYELQRLNAQHLKDGEEGAWGGFDIDAPRGDWPFRQLEHLMRLPADASDARRLELERQLEAASSLAFKVWKLDPVLRRTAMGLALVAAVLLARFVAGRWETPLGAETTVGVVVLFVVLLAASAMVPMLRWLRPDRAVRTWLARAVLATAGCLAANIHLRVFDPIYLRRGKVARLLRLD